MFHSGGNKVPYQNTHMYLTMCIPKHTNNYSKSTHYKHTNTHTTLIHKDTDTQTHTYHTTLRIKTHTHYTHILTVVL